jgi:hypothetical protein
MTPSFVPTSYAQALSRIFWPQPPKAAGENLYVILDAARDRQIYSTLRASDAQYLCLLPGPLHYSLAKAAPYLVLLDPAALFSRWLMEQAWCSEWGIFLSTKTPLKQLQGHFADLLKAQDPSGAVLHFRYYDPRVFRSFVPTLRDEQLQPFFGPVTRYLVPAENPNTLIEYAIADNEVAVQPTPLGERLYIQSARPKRPVVLHAILDAARNPAIYPALTACGAKVQCLYPDDTPPVVKRVAPHLLPLEPPTDLSQRFLGPEWGDNWGIALSSSLAAPEELLDHFRTLLHVEDPEGKILKFRFYDPRVLRTYLPTCNAQELRRIFGPVDQYFVASEAGNTLVFSLKSGGLATQETEDSAEGVLSLAGASGPELH